MANDMTQRLLALMANSEGANGTPTEAMLSELFGNDPRGALIAQYLRNSKVGAEQDDPALDDEEDLLELDMEQAQETEAANDLSTVEQASVDEFSLDRLMRILEDLNAKNESLRTENDELEEWNDTLAAALGACHRCWGERTACSVCGGKGRPGWRLPEDLLFKEFIAPAIRRWRKHFETRHRSVPRGEAIHPGIEEDHDATERTKP